MIVHLPADAVPGPLLMYSTVGRDTAPTEVTLSALGVGAWSADVTGVVGRWWPTVEYTIGTYPHRINLPYVDLPEAPGLVVTPEKVGTKAGLTLPLTEAQRETITDAILDAQSDVRAYLGRAIAPTLYTESGRRDNGRGHWNLTPLDEPLIEVLTVTPDTSYGEPIGTFTITYRAGLDAKNDPELRPIVRYVTAAALNSPEIILMWKAATRIKGDIKSVTTDGQSISYDTPSLGGGGAAGSGAPGALPALSSLDYWRVAGRRAYQRETPYRPPWPHSSMNGRRW